MISAFALLQGIEHNARTGRGLRLTPEETDHLRAVLELCEAHSHAQALDGDDEVSVDPGPVPAELKQ